MPDLRHDVDPGGTAGAEGVSGRARGGTGRSISVHITPSITVEVGRGLIRRGERPPKAAQKRTQLSPRKASALRVVTPLRSVLGETANRRKAVKTLSRDMEPHLARQRLVVLWCSTALGGRAAAPRRPLAVATVAYSVNPSERSVAILAARARRQ